MKDRKMFSIHRPTLGLLTLILGTVLTAGPALAGRIGPADATAGTRVAATPLPPDSSQIEALIEAQAWAASLRENPAAPLPFDGQALSMVEAEAAMNGIRQRLRALQTELSQHDEFLGLDIEATVTIEDRKGSLIEVPRYSFALPHYDAFIAGENALITSFTEGRAHDLDSWAALYPSTEEALADPAFTEGYVLAKLANILGLGVVSGALKDALGELLGTEFIWLQRDLRAGRYGQAKITLKRMLRKLVSKRARTILAKYVGKRIAGKVIADIAAKSLPVIGWSYLIAHAVWAIGAQIYRLLNQP